jgi:hypothetical protein
VEGGLVHADRDGRFLRLRPAPLAITMAAAPPTAAA